MYNTAPSKIIDLTPYLRRNRLQKLAYTLLALWTQYLSLGTLLLYGLLRVTVCRAIPLGAYCGPLAILWPTAYLLLLTSWVSDQLLWREEWED